MQKPILIGLLLVLGVLFIPTPQRPQDCGGGSALWNSHEAPKNAKYMKQIAIETVDPTSRAYADIKQDSVYWDGMPNDPISLCAGETVFRFNGDTPNTFIRYSYSTGVEF